MYLMAMPTDFREDFRALSARITSSNSKSLVFTDTVSKLSACLAYIEFLTEFTSVFVDNIRHADFRYLILKVEPMVLPSE